VKFFHLNGSWPGEPVRAFYHGFRSLPALALAVVPLALAVVPLAGAAVPVAEVPVADGLSGLLP
jgi:hypothetical protein